MNVQIETQIHEWDSDTAGIFLKLCNLLTFVKNREELETALKHTPFRERFNRNFLWGYGANHFWIVQRCPYNGTYSGNRLVIVEF